MRYQTLNKKQKERFSNFFKEKYGLELKGQIVKQSTEKLRIFTGNLLEHELAVFVGTVRVETIGIYLVTLDNRDKGEKEETIRFSFDAGFLAKDATKNVLELNDKQAKQWFKGEDITIDSEQQSPDTKEDLKLNNVDYPFVLLKYKDEIVGCGKLTQDKDKIINFVPKERRIKY